MADNDLEDGWRLELQPTLTEMANNLRKRPPSDRPVVVQVGRDRISVTPAERQVLLTAAERGGVGVPRHLLLVSDSMALRVKLLEDQAALAEASEEARGQAGSKVRYDVDMGMRLVRAMQGEMAVQMSTGKVEHGRRLAEHRGLVSEALQRAQRQLTDAGFEAVAAPAAASEADGRGTSPAPSRRGDQSRQSPRWVPHVVAGFLFLLLAVLLLQLWSGRPRDLPQVTVNDFAFLPGVEKVACRPPGVILVIPGDRWIKLSKGARTQAVGNAVRVVEHLGYRQLQIRARSGSVLAEWNKGGRTAVSD